MTIYVYLFTAQNIPSYILATNRLKEIVGGSELIENLTGSILDEVMDKVGANIQWSRRGDGTVYLFSSNANNIQRFASLWPLIVRQYAPDLEFIQTQGQANTATSAYAQAYSKLLSASNALVARLPLAPPLAKRSNRTGEPAIERTQQGEAVDAATWRKLNRKFWHSMNLSKRLDSSSTWANWPLHFTINDIEAEDEKKFPFINENYNLGLIHVEVNNLHQLHTQLDMIIDLQLELYVELFKNFFKTISQAMQQAVQWATEQVLLPNQYHGVYPARPIILGQNYLTILVRSDLALEFTRCFLTKFSINSGNCFQIFKQQFNLPQLPNRLTACAGIAYATVNQPLYLLHGLALSLCNHARKLATAQDKDHVPTSLSLHRVTTYFADDYTTILNRELTIGNLRQTLECYALEPNQGLPVLDNLLQLRELIGSKNMSQNSARELLGIVGINPAHAPNHYRRWREIMSERAGSKLLSFDNLLFELGITGSSGDLPYSGSTMSKLRSTPLGDIITLQSISDICKSNVYATTKN